MSFQKQRYYYSEKELSVLIQDMKNSFEGRFNSSGLDGVFLNLKDFKVGLSSIISFSNFAYKTTYLNGEVYIDRDGWSIVKFKLSANPIFWFQWYFFILLFSNSLYKDGGIIVTAIFLCTGVAVIYFISKWIKYILKERFVSVLCLKEIS